MANSPYAARAAKREWWHRVGGPKGTKSATSTLTETLRQLDVEILVAQRGFYDPNMQAEEVERACPSLRVERLRSGPEGGDMQVGARIVEGKVDVLVFLPDLMNPHPHEADFRALIRVALLADIPFALSPMSADHLAHGLAMAGDEERRWP